MKTYHKKAERQTSNVPSWTMLSTQYVSTLGMMLQAYSAFHNFPSHNLFLERLCGRSLWLEQEEVIDRARNLSDGALAFRHPLVR